LLETALTFPKGMQPAMKAIVMNRVAPLADNPVEYREFEDPVIASNEVLVRVAACGVCHSNIHLIEGDLRRWGLPASLPLIPGHEIVGIVAGVGKEVDDVKLGQKVGISVIWETCRKCEYCLRGDENLCPDRKISGEGVHGGYAEYMKAPHDFVYPIPDGLKDVEAATLFCPGVTAYRAVERANMQPGENVMIIGIGGVGHFSVQFAKLKGARVTAVDISEAQLNLAREMGADDAVLSGSAEEFTRSNKPTKVIMHTPAQAALDLATRVVKNRGTILMAVFGTLLVGFGGEVTIVTSMAGSKKDIAGVLEMASQGRVKVKATAYPLSEGIEVLKKLNRGEIVGRAVLVP
jgi:propanol-preferring alcohol dehydrogenase